MYLARCMRDCIYFHCTSFVVLNSLCVQLQDQHLCMSLSRRRKGMQGTVHTAVSSDLATSGSNYIVLCEPISENRLVDIATWCTLDLSATRCCKDTASCTRMQCTAADRYTPNASMSFTLRFSKPRIHELSTPKQSKATWWTSFG